MSQEYFENSILTIIKEKKIITLDYLIFEYLYKYHYKIFCTIGRFMEIDVQIVKEQKIIETFNNLDNFLFYQLSIQNLFKNNKIFSIKAIRSLSFATLDLLKKNKIKIFYPSKIIIYNEKEK